MGDVFAYTALATKCGFKRLERLDMRDTNIGDTEWMCFGRIETLRTFIAGRTIDDGTATTTDERLTDRCLSSLSTVVQQGDKECRLEVIGLTGTGVTNASMLAVGKALTKLRRMDVRGTRVTQAGACDLRKVRADCEVLFDPEGKNPLAGKPPVEEHNPDGFVLIQAPHFQ